MVERLEKIKEYLVEIVEGDEIFIDFYPFNYSADEVLFEVEDMLERVENLNSNNEIQTEILEYIKK